MSNKINDLLPPAFFIDYSEFEDNSTYEYNNHTNKQNNIFIDKPKFIHTNNLNGVENGSIILAKMFMSKMGNIARKCRTRTHLSELYDTTIKSWATFDIQTNISKQRLFKQVLFAIAHGIKLVRVKNKGNYLYWNRYRDNYGNLINK